VKAVFTRGFLQTFVASIFPLLLLAGCPLPFAFSPRGYPSTATASDPSTPSITAAPALTYSASSGSGTITSGLATTGGDTTITLASPTVGAVVYYTTNGSTPDPRSSATNLYSPSSPLVLKIANPTLGNVTSSLTVMATAIGPNMRPSLVTTATVTVSYPQAAAPEFSVDGVTWSTTGGSFTTDQSLQLRSTTPGATIYYTLVSPAGSVTRPEPGQFGTHEYAGPITLTGPATTYSIAAIAVKSQMIDSITSGASYSVSYLGTAPPAISPPGQTLSDTANVTISSDAGSTIWYTIDGTAPVVGSGLSIPSGSSFPLAGGPGGVVTVRARASKPSQTDSTESTVTYTFMAAVPVASPPGGAFNNPLTVALSTTTNGATIYYTTNGLTPTTGDTPYTGPIPVATNTTIMAIAARPNFQPSTAGVNTYTLQPAPTTFSPAGGPYYAPLSVTLSNISVGATIYYTTDGSLPTTSSAVYSGPIPITANGETTTITALAVVPGLTAQTVSSASNQLHTIVQAVIGIATSNTIQITIPALTGTGNYQLMLISYPSSTTLATSTNSGLTFTHAGLSPSTTYQYYAAVIYPDISTSIGGSVWTGMTQDASNMPPVVPVTIPGSYATPSGWTPTFFTDSGPSGTTGTASLAVQEGGYIFIPYSQDSNNDMSIMIRTFDSQGNFVKDTQLNGTRYVYKVTVDAVNGIITYTGQSDTTASISWASLKM